MLASSHNSGRVAESVRQSEPSLDPRYRRDLNDPAFQWIWFYCNQRRFMYAAKEGAD